MSSSAGPLFLSLEPVSAGRVARRCLGGLAANVVVVATLIWVGSGIVENEPEQRRRLVSVLVSPQPTSVAPPEIRPIPRPRAKRAVIPEVSVLKPLPKMELPTPPVMASAPAATIPQPSLPNLPKREIPVVVGSFSTPQPVAVREQPRVLNASFETPNTPTTPAKSRSVVESTQFGGLEVASKSKSSTTVAAASGPTGFGMAESQSPARREALVQSIGGFETALPPARQQRSNLAEGDLKPVEILAKPQPAYTEAARQLGIEGEVALRIQFGADGKLKVLSVVKGLGHGLDENAAIAATQIQFRPAMRAGQPVEQVAVLRVQFQLVR
jgi:TonB family protein